MKFQFLKLFSFFLVRNINWVMHLHGHLSLSLTENFVVIRDLMVLKQLHYLLIHPDPRDSAPVKELSHRQLSPPFFQELRNLLGNTHLAA